MNSHPIASALATERSKTFQAEAEAFRLAKLAKQARRSSAGELPHPGRSPLRWVRRRSVAIPAT